MYSTLLFSNFKFNLLLHLSKNFVLVQYNFNTTFSFNFVYQYTNTPQR